MSLNKEIATWDNEQCHPVLKTQHNNSQLRSSFFRVCVPKHQQPIHPRIATLTPVWLQSRYVCYNIVWSDAHFPENAARWRVIGHVHVNVHKGDAFPAEDQCYVSSVGTLLSRFKPCFFRLSNAIVRKLLSWSCPNFASTCTHLST